MIFVTLKRTLVAFGCVFGLLTPVEAHAQDAFQQMHDKVSASMKYVFTNYASDRSVADYGGSQTVRRYKMIELYDRTTHICRMNNGRMAMLAKGRMETQKLVETYSNGRSWPRPGDGDFTYRSQYRFTIPLRLSSSGNTLYFDFDTPKAKMDWTGDGTSFPSRVYRERFLGNLRGRGKANEPLRRGEKELYARSPDALNTKIAGNLKSCASI